MTAERKEEATVGRRGFLGALAGLSAGAALVAPGTVGQARAQTTEEERKRSRYQETEHVRRFYETNRY
jgi:hypothetical protein